MEFSYCNGVKSSYNGSGGSSNGHDSNNSRPQNFHNGTIRNLPFGNQNQQFLNYQQNYPRNYTYQNQNVVYRGQEYQNAYGYGPTNNVPQYINPLNYPHAIYQQQQEFHSVQAQPPIPGHPTYEPNYYGPSISGNQQNQTIQDSSPNFRVTSATTQISNESESLEGIQLLDISSDYPQHQKSDGLQNNEFPPLKFTCEDVDEALKSSNSDGTIQMSDNYCSQNDQHILDTADTVIASNNFVYHSQSVAPPINNIIVVMPCSSGHQTQPLVIPHEHQMKEVKGVPAPPAKIRSTTSSASSSSSSGTTKNSVGRPAEYENDEQRKEAHKEASKKSYKKRKEEKAEEKLLLATEVMTLEKKTPTLGQQYENKLKECESLLNANKHLMSEKDKNDAEKALKNSKATVAKLKYRMKSK
uniref:BZIP domain-containing protein n=1 Tax=Panagrolaimus sp. ES5 TaxID=591445 RepID=A0AC34GY11_9BILA